MRSLACLTLLAAAALFFSAPENAFAHSGHHHAQQTHYTSAQPQEPAQAHELSAQTEVVVSAASDAFEKCAHKEKHSDCGSCCACAGGSSVGLPAPELFGGLRSARSERSVSAERYEARQAFLDLNRPPKSFA